MATVALNSREGKWIMVSAILASSMAFIDSTALNVVLPSLQKGLQASGADLFWILNAYLLVLATLLLIGGSLGDKLGRKKVFMAGILIFICGFRCLRNFAGGYLSHYIQDDTGHRRCINDTRQPFANLLLNRSKRKKEKQSVPGRYLQQW